MKVAELQRRKLSWFNSECICRLKESIWWFDVLLISAQ